MATVTISIRLRRSEGRSPVDPDELARTLLDELESSILDSEFSVDDSAGDIAVYEITGVTAVHEPVDLTYVHGRAENFCARCGSAIASDPMGRPRLYCSPACRQAAHRARLAGSMSVPSAVPVRCPIEHGFEICRCPNPTRRESPPTPE
jgi:endogenous inhibitor of DNA gyrase (YacG/DUF329 family)